MESHLNKCLLFGILCRAANIELGLEISLILWDSGRCFWDGFLVSECYLPHCLASFGSWCFNSIASKTSPTLKIIRNHSWWILPFLCYCKFSPQEHSSEEYHHLISVEYPNLKLKIFETIGIKSRDNRKKEVGTLWIVFRNTKYGKGMWKRRYNLWSEDLF